MFLSATGIQSSNLSVTLLLKMWFLYILALYLNVNNFQTFLSFFSGWVFFRACATFGVLAENSVVLWRIR